jgi:1-acyl-sn-glycerol-3-phosphate acyltransferase
MASRPTRRGRLRSRLRAAGRAGALAAWTAACFLGWLAGAPLLARLPAPAWHWRSRWFRLWARGALALLGVEVDVRGVPPAAPFLLVCNHLGYLDVLVLASRLDAAFVAKAEVASWPMIGLLCRSMGTLFVDRGRKSSLPAALAAIEGELSRGRGVVLFPEGTSSDGARVLPFHPSLLAAALRAGMPVSWAALQYRTPRGAPPAGDAVCWWGEMAFLPHLWNLLALPGIEAKLRLGDEQVAGGDRKELADRLWAAIAARLEGADLAGRGGE